MEDGEAPNKKEKKLFYENNKMFYLSKWTGKENVSNTCNFPHCSCQLEWS